MTRTFNCHEYLKLWIYRTNSITVVYSFTYTQDRFSRFFWQCRNYCHWQVCIRITKHCKLFKKMHFNCVSVINTCFWNNSVQLGTFGIQQFWKILGRKVLGMNWFWCLFIIQNVSKEASAQGFFHGSMYTWEVIARGLLEIVGNGMQVHITADTLVGKIHSDQN